MKAEKSIKKLKSGESMTVVGFGDSLTYGWMVRKGFFDFLEEMLADKYPGSDCNFINCGVPGDTASGGVGRLSREVIPYNPDCTLLQFGLNDFAMGITEKSYRNNIQAIIEQLTSRTESEIVLVTSVCMGTDEGNEQVNRYYRQLEDLSEEYNLPCVRVHEYWKEQVDKGTDFYSLVQMDYVHPTLEGYRFMAEAIMKVFE